MLHLLPVGNNQGAVIGLLLAPVFTAPLYFVAGAKRKGQMMIVSCIYFFDHFIYSKANTAFSR